jgi:hypothetical protein
MAAGEHEFTPKRKIKWPDIEQLCEWIREAWASISPALIEKSFKKCGISNKLDGTEDDYLWDSDSVHASSVDDDDDESSREEYLKVILAWSRIVLIWRIRAWIWYNNMAEKLTRTIFMLQDTRTWKVAAVIAAEMRRKAR